MRGIAAAAVLTVALGLPAAAHSAGLGGLLLGINGLLTFPADPICDAITPPEDIQDFPAISVVGYPLGFVFGTVLGVVRATTGAMDVALTQLWIIPNLSPEPRFDVIPGYDLEADVL